MSTPERRPYDSPLRRGQAAATRAAIIAAGTRLFIERGYGATSIDDIAREAGVSRATVFSAVGPKATLLKTAYDVALVGDDEPVPMPQRPWAQGVRRATTVAEMLEAYADLVVILGERIGAITEAIRGAAATDPEARDVLAKIEDERLVGASNIIAMASERGGIRSGLDPAAAADAVWVFNDPSLYVRLVDRRGWSRTAYRNWVAANLRFQLQ